MLCLRHHQLMHLCQQRRPQRQKLQRFGAQTCKKGRQGKALDQPQGRGIALASPQGETPLIGSTYTLKINYEH